MAWQEKEHTHPDESTLTRWAAMTPDIRLNALCNIWHLERNYLYTHIKMEEERRKEDSKKEKQTAFLGWKYSPRIKVKEENSSRSRLQFSFCLFFPDRVLSCSPGYPVTQYVAQVGLKLMMSRLPQSHEYWDYSCQVPCSDDCHHIYLWKVLSPISTPAGLWRGGRSVN